MKNTGTENPQVIRLRKEEIETLFGMFAAQSELINAQQTMEKRLKSVKNGWRDIRMLSKMTETLIDRLLLTVPIEKLVMMRRRLPSMKYKVTCGHIASTCEGDGEVVMSYSDAKTIMEAAHEQCKMCMGSNCRACALGKALNNNTNIDRDGTSWGMVNLYECAGENK